MGARNQVGIGLLYRPASLRSWATQFQTRFLESIPRPIRDLSFRLCTHREETYSTKREFGIWNLDHLITWGIPYANTYGIPRNSAEFREKSTIKIPWNSAKFRGIPCVFQKIPYSAGSEKNTSVDTLTTVYVPSLKLGLSHPLSPASVHFPLEPGGGGHTRLRVRVGEVQFRRLEKKLSTLPTLWLL
jgi:hypothetical protein